MNTSLLPPVARISAACLLTALVGSFSPTIFAQNTDPDLIAYEGFEYDVGSSLEQLEGGIGWDGPWLWRLNFSGGGTKVTDSAIVQAGSLSYGNLAVRGNHVLLSGELGQLELGRGLAEAVAGEPGTSTYISYIGQRIGPVDDPTGDSWAPNVYPRGTSIRLWSDTSERLSIGNYSNQVKDEWAIYGSGLPLTHSGVSFSEDLAFVVARVDHKDPTAGVGDNIYVWINPDLSQPEDTATADIQLVNITETQGEEGAETQIPVHVGDLTWVSPFAGNADYYANNDLKRPHAELLVDELRIGRTYASVTPDELRWAGFLQDDARYVNTRMFLQWIYLGDVNWNWSYSLNTWLYLPESWVTSAGAWTYFLDTNANPPEVGEGVATWEGFPIGEDGWVDTGNFLQMVKVNLAPWIWSETLQTWFYIPEGYLDGGSGYAYVWDSNVDEVTVPGQAIVPAPLNGEEHVNTSGGVATLAWSGGQGAASHDVYFGTDPEAVANATQDSPEFLGNTTTTSVEIEEDFYSLNQYFWRVDAVNSAGVTTGEVWSFRPRQLAFPGAEGYGRFAVGGRHGRVVHVTNLNDSGPGSLRAAIEVEEGPRIVVFDVGGLITLESDITIDSEDKQLTIAGQTAPYPGITVRKHKLGISGGQDVVVRFLRIKVGNIAEQTSDGTGMRGSNHSIMDHMTVGWSIDEAFSSRDAKNITLQRTMLVEALNEAGHKNYPEGDRHGYAASVGGDIASFHHNLLAHCAGRNWSMAGGLDRTGAYAGRLDFTNNVVYNWDGRTTDGGAHEVNFVGNYYKGGPATENLNFLNPQHEEAGTGTQRYYVEGNVMDMVPIPGINDRSKQVGPENQEEGYTTDPEYPDAYVDAPFFDNHVETHSARLAYKLVLSDVGANQPTVDNHDYRVIGEALNRTFTYRGSKTNLPGLIDNENDLGDPWAFYETATARPDGFDTDGDGLPNWYEEVVGTDPDSAADDFSDMRGDPDGDGFTRMDDYLAWLATPHVECDRNGSVEVDLADLTRGFTASPVYTIESVSGGDAVVLLDDVTAKFTPGTDFTGLAEFTFSVTDAEGDSMTRTVGVRVLPAE